MKPSREPALRAIAWMLIATIGPGTPAHAGDILRGGAALMPTRRTASATGGAGAAVAARSKATAQDRLSRTTQAIAAVKAMQSAARAAARSRARLTGFRPNLQLPRVPDGLGKRGLDLDGQPRGANRPDAARTKDGVSVVIEQTDQQAFLNWRTFNVGKKTTLTFDQSAGKADASEWIAFNKVSDPSGAPSQILGSIKAEGQVYVLNQNGIIFGGSSQVNVHTLVASSLPINDNLVARGLLNNPDSQFLFSTLPLAAGSKGTPAFTPAAPLTKNGEVGDVVVREGALIESPTSAEKIGGRVALIGANVENAGTISTPDGQTILAAGLQVAMTAHDGSDPSLRGVDVFVGDVGDYAGAAINSGLIDAPRANVTITGKSVQQLGVIDSSTSVSLNGRIDLLANYGAVTNIAFDPTNSAKGPQFLFQSAGAITLGTESVTRIVPEIASEEAVIGTELALPSQINVQGLSVHLGRDAIVLAPNAGIGVKAGTWNFTPDPNNPKSLFAYTGGQIYLDAGATIDVSGTTDAAVPLDQFILKLELRGAELADSPLQRAGILRAIELVVDARERGVFHGREWIGTPLGDASGFVDLIQRGAGQLTTAGGTVDLHAGNSVVLQRGSAIDVSGGWMQVAGGFVETTRVTSGGEIFDISEATPDRVYDGIYTTTSTRTRAKWGITETFTRPLAWTGRYYDSAYIEGSDGGSIAITAPAMALDGELRGQAVTGPRQLRENPVASELPDAGRLALTFQAQDSRPHVNRDFAFFSPTPPEIIFRDGVAQAAVGPFALDENGDPLVLRDEGDASLLDPFGLPASRENKVILSPSLLGESGFGELVVDNADGDISIPASIALSAPPSGSISLTAANIDVAGSVSAPGGSLSFTVYDFSPYKADILKGDPTSPDFHTPDPRRGRGRFTLGSRGVLSAAGLTIDDGPGDSAPALLPIVRDGGTITINSTSAAFAPGSLVDVSGGFTRSVHDEQIFGNAGGIVIKTGQDPNLTSLLGGTLALGGRLEGFSGATGGSLSVQAPVIQVGGAGPIVYELPDEVREIPNALGGIDSLGQAEVTRRTISATWFPEEFFSEGGFGSYSLTGIGAPTGIDDKYLPGVRIAADTRLSPVSKTLFLMPRAADGTDMNIATLMRPEGVRTPVSLSFAAPNVQDFFAAPLVVRGEVVMEPGARIRTDALADVSISGNAVTIHGSIVAPGGGITIAGGATYSQVAINESFPLPTVSLGSESRLSTVGKTVLLPDDRGLRSGFVLPGGSIHVSGNIVAAEGSVLDVSGATGTLDLPPLAAGLTTATRSVPVNSGINAALASLGAVPVRVDSDAGAISLAGSAELFTDATLIGRAGGPTALGGSLSVESGRFYAPTETATPLDVTLRVTQSDPTILADPLPSLFFPGEQTAIGRVVTNRQGKILPGIGYFAADRYLEGGFDSLTLGGTVQFRGDVGIDARQRLTVATGGVILAMDDVKLSAPYVALGTPFRPPLLEDQANVPFPVGLPAFRFAPSHGPGTLTVIADLIDVGNLSLRNIHSARLIADGGDIRGDGTLNIAGNLILRAGQIYPATAVNFTLAAYDHNGHRGAVTIRQSGTRDLPLSAGGELNVYGSIIEQSGTLRAPLGTINLGWDGTGAQPAALLAGSTLPFPVTQRLVLGAGSTTSVSAVDPLSGEGLLIPYGISPDGRSWIDPAGADISGGGAPAKEIKLGAINLATRAGSMIDISGGGDLYAYRWIEGLGGTRDVLAASDSFAILPGTEANFAPFAAFNDTVEATNLGGDRGYVNPRLAVGDRIHLGASDVLPAGDYTLLPARYALLPGAVLVTPKAGDAMGTLALPGGASLVSGTRFNDLNTGRTVPTLSQRFEVAPESVVRARAQYDDFFGNAFLSASAESLDIDVPRLPIDAGHLVFRSTEGLRLNGSVNGRAPTGGRGAFIDVSSARDIVIAGLGGVKAAEGVVVLDAARLNGWGAESLLVGGVRSASGGDAAVEVNTGRLTVDNAGAPLSGPEIILVAKEKLRLAGGAEIRQAGELSDPAERLLFSGDGATLRVSSDRDAAITRSDVPETPEAAMVIGAGVELSGTSLILDSTFATRLAASAILDGRAITLDSGQISIALDHPGELQPTEGLVLAGRALDSLGNAEFVSLLSYSSIDIYGSGQFANTEFAELELHAGEIRGFNNAGGAARFDAAQLVLDNNPHRDGPGSITAPEGRLEFNTRTISLGSGRLDVDQFAELRLDASAGITATGRGRLVTEGGLLARTAFLTGEAGATQTIKARRDLRITPHPDATGAVPLAGLGASLTLQGSSVVAGSDIILPSGSLELRATTGDLTVGGRLAVDGSAQRFNDLTKFTGAGRISLIADKGGVTLLEGGALSVAAQPGGGNAGTLDIRAGAGSVALNGALFASAGAGGDGGSFSLDVARLPDLADISAALNEAAFTESRTFRVRSGDVRIDGAATARHFALSADSGSIKVTGTIDASGKTGGSIALAAAGDLTLENGSLLSVAGEGFDNAGKGGSVTLEAGSQIDGIVSATAFLDIQNGATIDLSVASASEGSAARGQFTGTLHLRAPQTASQTDLQAGAINGEIRNASSIVVEGYRLFDLTGTSGVITSAVQNSVRANGETFLGANGDTTPAYTALLDRLLENNHGLASVLSLRPGAEIINRSGDLTLGTTGSTASSDWNLATYRFGPQGAPGVLTLRATGNLTFFNALSDGFATSAYNSLLLAPNAALPLNAQSWSYRLAAGADLAAADFHRVQPLARLASTAGSLQLGKNNGANVSNSNGTNNRPGASALTSLAVQNRYQVIRTGSGGIDISTGRDVQLLNHFATITTAGTLIADPTLGGTFDVPQIDAEGGRQTLGAIQQNPAYPAQYTLGGGDVTIRAQGNITHLTRDSAGNLIPDSQRQLPINWLYRRGAVDPATGEFAVVPVRTLTLTSLPVGGDIASTTWWIDFSNFFEGVGALGGGNVTLLAGGEVANVDAVVPTNARMPRESGGKPDAGALVELGGGDLVVRAGHDIDAGVYYVERGKGTLDAGGSIHTNATRSPSLGAIRNPADVLAPETWLPTTLFLGKGGFDVSARGDVLLGPVVNPFLLPGGANNTFWYKSYFSTYAPESAVNVSSLGGAVTLRTGATLTASNAGDATPLLQAWFATQLVLRSQNPQSTSFFQPWLRLDETSVAPFGTATALMPSTLRATAFAGDINLIGDLTLSPSARGTIDLAAAMTITGLHPNGLATIDGIPTVTWGSSIINLSDANPRAIPGIASPLGYQILAGSEVGPNRETAVDFLFFLDELFAETGSTSTVLQTRQALHAPGLLHKGDPEPLRLYALDGDISGLTLFSPKAARVITSHDLTDVALYIQNLDEGDITVVAAGRDIIPYNANSSARGAALSPGNVLNLREFPLAGDIQISGPGTLEVLAGRNLDLGTGGNNSDGTGVGITTIGNARNTSLPFEGASIIAGAGIGPSRGLSASALDFETFIDEFLTGASADRLLAELDASLGDGEFADLPRRRRDQLALAAFHLVLRNAGRDFSVAGSPGFGNYDAGFAAIAALFPDIEGPGDITTRSRDIRTRNGGGISLFAPGGELRLADNLIGEPLAPPGIVTESGGDISIFTDADVDIGVARIFTLRGGNEIIWSSTGDIAAGSSSKTVKSAPPTRVIIDPQSADVKTDLAGLATGGGIGVLATVEGVEPGDVDLIAPVGVVDAGDAGIRVSGNLNIAATQVLNASNIAVAGTTVGAPPAPVVTAPNIAGLTSASTTSGAANSTLADVAAQARAPLETQEPPSIINVEIIGYGGGDNAANEAPADGA